MSTEPLAPREFSGGRGWTILERSRLLAVVTITEVVEAAPLAECLWAGGITAVEVTLRTPVALAAVETMRRAMPSLLVAVGTVLTVAEAEAARVAGAEMALAPGCDPLVIRRCARLDLPFIPGVGTATDIQVALAEGCRWLKWFPAEPLGGARGLRILSAPFAHRGVRFLPLGGIDQTTVRDYLAEPLVGAVGGSWIAPTQLIRQHRWAEIRERAAHAVQLTSSFSSRT